MMSALGQKQTSEQVQVMSALPPKADIGTHSRDVCFVPLPDSALQHTGDVAVDTRCQYTYAAQEMR